jgi:oxygen-independent coproporphyrinogen-3 oxidase
LRTTKPKQPRDYQEQVRAGAAGAGVGAGVGESRYIAATELPFEFMLNALRLNEGFTAGDYRRSTGLPLASVEGKLAAAVQRGLLTAGTDGWRPTELGRRFLNDLLLSFLA